MLLRRFKQLASALLLAGAAAGLAGCAGAPKTQTPQPVETVPEKPLAQKARPQKGAPPAAPAEALPVPAAVKLRIGLLAPLSGANEGVGRALVNAATMALFDADDATIQILPHDTGDAPDSAAQAAQALLDAGATVLLGPLTGPQTSAVAPLAAARHVPVLSFSNDRLVAGNGVYVLGFLPGQQASRIAQFAAARGLSRFAALAPLTPYGDRMVEAFQAAVAESGGKIMRIERYQPGQQAVSRAMRSLANYDARKKAMEDEKAALSKLGGDLADAQLKGMAKQDSIADVDFDALFIPEGGEALKIISPLLPYFNIDTKKVQILGSGLWDQAATRREEELNGAWFATPPSADSGPLDLRYRQIYRQALPKVATLAYDGVTLLAALNKTGDFSAAALENPGGFAGINGIYRLTHAGATERGLAVQQVTPDAFLLLDAAPTGF